MHSTLGRYLIRQMLLGTLTTLLLLAALDFFFALIAEMGSIGRGNYGLQEALVYVLLTLPRRIYDLIPIAALLGSLLWLGNLASHSELIAMRAAGVSVRRIIFWVMQAGLIVVIAMLLIGEVIASRAEAMANEIKMHATDGRITAGRLGIWARDGEHILRASTVLPDNILHDLTVFHLDPANQLLSMTSIQSAQYRDGLWYLEQIHRTRLAPTATEVERVESEEIPHLLASEYLNLLSIEPRQMSGLELLRYIHYLRANHLETAVYEVALWQRITLPASTWVMLLLAMPFLFTHQRDGDAGRRLFFGMLLGVSYLIVLRLMTHLGLLYNVPPWLSASAPLWFFLFVAMLFFRRIPR